MEINNKNKENKRRTKRRKREDSKREILKKGFQANVSALSKSSFKAFKKPLIQAHQLLKCTFKSPSTLRKSKKDLLLLSKVYLKLYLLIEGAFLCT